MKKWFGVGVLVGTFSVGPVFAQDCDKIQWLDAVVLGRAYQVGLTFKNFNLPNLCEELTKGTRLCTQSSNPKNCVKGCDEGYLYGSELLEKKDGKTNP